jgi:DNA polymerase III subunit beta
MKIELLQENLTKALSVVSRSVSTKATMPVLSHILFRAGKEGLFLSATNLETGVNFEVPSKVEEGGDLSIPARIVLEYVSMLPAGKLSMESRENQLLIKSGGFEATIDGMAASEFPKLPVFPKEELLTFSRKDFLKVAGWVCFSAATDEGRPVLTGVKTVVSKDNVVFAATDGYRLSVLKFKNQNAKVKNIEEMAMIIPARSLVEVSRIVTERDEKKDLLFALTEEKNQAIFSVDGIELSTRLIEGVFPNFEKIIPSSLKVEVEIGTEGFLKAVRAASVFARDSANIIKLRLSKKEGVVISANAPQVGSNSVVVDAKVEGEEMEVAFNSRFLLEFLANTTAQAVNFSTEGALSPGVFKVANEGEFIHVIMPVRVQ